MQKPTSKNFLPILAYKQKCGKFVYFCCIKVTRNAPAHRCTGLEKAMKYTTELADEILTELATTTKGFTAICKEFGMAPKTGWEWLRKYPDFAEGYKLARTAQTELAYDEIRTIADEPFEETALTDKSGRLITDPETGYPLMGVDPALAMAETQRRKLQVSVRQFALAKLQAPRFGENRTLAVDVKVRRQVSPDQFTKLIEAAERAAVKGPEPEYDEAEEVTDTPEEEQVNWEDLM